MTGAAVSCRWCGESGPVDTVAGARGWMSESVDGALRWLCPACVRRYLRDIEGKLPTEYW